MPLSEERANLSRKTKPLLGRQVVITRPRSQASDFVRGIEDLGAEVVEFPTIEILPPESYEALDTAIQNLETYHWIIFTSINGVRHFWERFMHLKRDIHDLDRIKVVAIGPETAKELGSINLRADLVPREYRAEGILQKLKAAEMVGKRILLPRAVEARDILPKTLQEWGARVDVLEAYQTVPAKSDFARLRLLLLQKKIDMITFTSSSTVTHFFSLFSEDDRKQLLTDTAVACIGPITQGTAEEMGIQVDVVARDYTIPGLVEAVVEYFTRQR